MAGAGVGGLAAGVSAVPFFVRGTETSRTVVIFRVGTVVPALVDGVAAVDGVVVLEVVVVVGDGVLLLVDWSAAKTRPSPRNTRLNTRLKKTRVLIRRHA